MGAIPAPGRAPGRWIPPTACRHGVSSHLTVQMTDRSHPLAGVLRSLPLAILCGAALSGIVMTFVYWLSMRIVDLPHMPHTRVWVDFALTRAVVGACVGAAGYAAAQFPQGRPRWYLCWILIYLLAGGEMHDFMDRSLGAYLAGEVVSSLLMGVIVGTVAHRLQLRKDRRSAAAGHPGSS
jgi:hypothetical protein